MSERYKVIDSTLPNFITLTITDWVDLFVRPQYCKVLDESLNYCVQNMGISVHAYVYMTSHVHMIVSSAKTPIPEFVRNFKVHLRKNL
ncbi:MAG: hypothetical protein MI810_11140 [Flavobacteriales bacterium]|nr:hypothetical protein [Flavobacteriales bacterium]